jgi:antitoxin component YwqK of YwqJK toxin-antitoxin module
MKRIIYIILLIYFYFFTICEAQNNNTKNIKLENFPLNLNVDINKKFPFWDTTITFFQGKKNVVVYQKKDKIYQVEYYLSGQVKVKSELKIILTQDSIFNSDFQSIDSVPRLIVKYRLYGIENGKYFEYYKDGKIKTKGIMFNGDMEKKWYYYDEKGSLIKVELWHNGILRKTLKNFQ